MEISGRRRAHSLHFFAAPLGKFPGLASCFFAEEIKNSGVGDARKITSHFFVARNRAKKGLAELHKLGFTTIVDLRGERHGRIQRERTETEAFGMTFANSCASLWPARTDLQLAKFSRLPKNVRRKKYLSLAGSVTAAPEFSWLLAAWPSSTDPRKTR